MMGRESHGRLPDEHGGLSGHVGRHEGRLEQSPMRALR